MLPDRMMLPVSLLPLAPKVSAPWSPSASEIAPVRVRVPLLPRMVPLLSVIWMGLAMVRVAPPPLESVPPSSTILPLPKAVAVPAKAVTPLPMVVPPV